MKTDGRITELKKMFYDKLITAGELNVLTKFNERLERLLIKTNLQDNCKHENIKYCSEYEARSWDMQCSDCGKYGSNEGLKLDGASK